MTIQRQWRSALLLALLWSAPLTAQTGVPGQKFAWDQAAPDLVSAQGYTYRHYPDGAIVGVVFVAVTCTGTASPFVCEALIPAFTPGSHTVTLSAANVAGESPKSAPFVFTFIVTPGTPANIRIK